MKILHLFSDWKWTGPAEPTVLLCEALQQRGHEVMLAYRRPPAGSEDDIAQRMVGRHLAMTDRFHLRPLGRRGSGQALLANLMDLTAMRRFIDEERFELIHVHHSHDHLLAGIAARLSKTKPVVVRSDHKRDAIKPTLGNRILISILTDGIIAFSETAWRKDSGHLPISRERVGRGPVALELDRYDPRRVVRDMRPVFGIPPDAVVIGMVARFQKYRRTNVFLMALAELIQEFSSVRALLVGRSSEIRQSVIEPTRQLGLTNHVILAGYRREDYLDTIAAMDIFAFLMAGSDGTARALREALAMGKPAVVAKRGILPELVEHGGTGLVVEDTPESLCSALRTLVVDRTLRERMGRRAREKALNDFRLERQGEAIDSFYRSIVEMGPRVGQKHVMRWE